MQMLFGTAARVAVQDPAYPVYVDSSVMFGRYDEFNEVTKQYKADPLSTLLTWRIYFCHDEARAYSA